MAWETLFVTFNLANIADALAEIASKTQDPETGRQLTEVVEQLLTAAGLPPEQTPDLP